MVSFRSDGKKDEERQVNYHDMYRYQICNGTVGMS